MYICVHIYIYMYVCIQLHSLNLMTSNLFPGYVACFKDEHISIQAEAIALAGSLGLQHPMILMAIKQLLQDSPCWTIKICALRALAQIKECDEQLVEQLMWVVRFEKMPSVRTEACKTIAKLGLDEERVLKSLRDLVIADDDPAVVKEAQQTLVELGQPPDACDDMLQSVCRTVKHLSTKEAITNAVRMAEITKSTNYVIASRPTPKLSARDYLNHKCRSLIINHSSPKLIKKDIFEGFKYLWFSQLESNLQIFSAKNNRHGMVFPLCYATPKYCPCKLPC